MCRIVVFIGVEVSNTIHRQQDTIVIAMKKNTFPNVMQDIL